MAASTTAFARTCEVALRLDDQVTLGALQLEIGYGAAPGTWEPTAKGIDCVADAPNTLAPFVDDPAIRTVTASFLSLSGIFGPRKLAHCYFVESGGTVTAQDFTIVVKDATTVDANPTWYPHISVLLPDCGTETTTTTTTSTTVTVTTTTAEPTTTTDEPVTTTTEEPVTTTEEPVTTTEEPVTTTTLEPVTTTSSTTSTTVPYCGDGVVEDNEECDDGNTVAGDGCDANCTAAIICGDANDNDHIQTSDALLVLRAAIGQHVACPKDRCDADGDEVVRASDSLRVLKRAVGQSVVMACPQA